ncbi:MAG: serine hydrolase, partial [Deltaproteobacteria bacterium]|nr:serine hydrolase [Deltaproteobacteria bacterium]
VKRAYYSKNIGFIAFCIFLIFFVASCAARYNRYGLPQYDYKYLIPQQLDDGWQTSSLDSEGVDSGNINEMMRNILEGDIDNIHGIVVIKNGKLVLEEYFDGFDRDTKHRIFSASKSVTSILIGMAIDRGMIKDVDTKVYEFFPEYERTKWIDQQYAINLKQVLTMTAGLDWNDWKYPDYDSRDTTRQMARSGDWLEFVLNRDIIEPAGKQFAYNNGLTMLLGGILKNTSGQNAINFADKNLFARLGISDYTWDRGKGGIVNTAWGLSMKPRDMAKIGYLFLKGGKWHNKRIVSQDWVDDSVKDYAKQDVFLGTGYGYQWWCGTTIINGQRIEAFYAAGHGGQYIFVCPALDFVTVVTSKWIGNPFGEFRPQMLLVNYILPAMLPSAPPQVIKPEPSRLEKYAGEYEFPKWKLKATVRREADRLYLDLPKRAEKQLKPLAENQFLYSLKGYGDVRLDFTEDGAGEITQMVAYFGYANITFRKTS